MHTLINSNKSMWKHLIGSFHMLCCDKQIINKVIYVGRLDIIYFN
jgi:hypothetical protein